MEQFRLLKNDDIYNVSKYLENNHLECSFFIGNMDNYGLQNKIIHKRSGDYYGFFIDNKIKGVFLFTNMGSFIPHYEDDSILNKIILLKTIKKYKPKYMFGVKRIVEPLWKIINKTVKWFKYNECFYMVLNKNNYQPFYTENEIVKAQNYNFMKAVDFLIEVEKAFERNPKTVNDLKNKIYDRSDEEEYLYLLENGRVVSQGEIQTTTSKINQVAGIYTLPEYRGKGYARAVVSKLCHNILSRGKIPTLTVVKDNEAAIKVYKEIGFEHYDDYLTIELEIL